MLLRPALCSVLLTPLLAQPAAPPTQPKAAAETTPGQAVDAAYGHVVGQFLPAADAMPEDKFGFAPKEGEFKGAMTFAQQLKHVASVNYMVGAAILGEKPPADLGSGEAGPAALQTKAEILKYLKDSFAYARRAIAAITAKSATEARPSPFGQGTITPLGMATLLSFHAMDHYGQMAVYLRMNGIIPPASRKQPA